MCACVAGCIYLTCWDCCSGTFALLSFAPVFGCVTRGTCVGLEFVYSAVCFGSCSCAALFFVCLLLWLLLLLLSLSLSLSLLLLLS